MPKKPDAVDIMCYAIAGGTIYMIVISRLTIPVDAMAHLQAAAIYRRISLHFGLKALKAEAAYGKAIDRVRL